MCKLTCSFAQQQELVAQKKTEKYLLLYVPNEQEEIFVFDRENKARTKLEDLSPVLLPFKSNSTTKSIVAFDNDTFLAKKRSTDETGIADFSGNFRPFPKDAFVKVESLEMTADNNEASDYLTIIWRDDSQGKRRLGSIHKKSGAYVEPAFDDIDLLHAIDEKLIVSKTISTALFLTKEIN